MPREWAQKQKRPGVRMGSFRQASRLRTPRARHVQADTRVSAWEKHRTPGQPSTEEAAHQNPKRERASTKQVTQFQEATTPSCEAPDTCSLPTQRSVSPQQEPRRRCSIPTDLHNSGLDSKRTYLQCGADAHAYIGIRTKHSHRKVLPSYDSWFEQRVWFADTSGHAEAIVATTVEPTPQQGTW